MKILPGIDREHFPELLKEKNYALGAEIGVEKGDHALHLLKNWQGSLILVDCWKHQDPSIHCDSGAGITDQDQENNYQLTIKRTAPFVGRVKIARAFSVEAAKDAAEGSLDFIYLDGNHSYPAVCADLRAWYPKVRSGGLISGHDFVDSGKPFGVKSAVLEFIADLQVDLYVSNEEWKTFYFEKP
jgi:hypothetical protein